MKNHELILDVSKKKKRDIYGGKICLFYTFKTNGIPGHNVYHDIPEYRIEGVPEIGLMANYIAGENALNSYFLPLWRIIKSNENIK